MPVPACLARPSRLFLPRREGYRTLGSPSPHPQSRAADPAAQAQGPSPSEAMTEGPVPQQPERDRTWVVIPAFREAHVIRSTVESARSLYPNVVVVDDGSDDATGAEALAGGATLITHPVNLGQGAALQTGIDYALRRGAGYVVTFDADGQHQIADVDHMLATLQAEGLDAVLGSRFLGTTRDLPALRKVVLKLAIVFTNLTCGIQLTDTHNGLRVFSAQAAAKINIQHNGMAHASEILEQVGRAKMRYREVPVTVLYTDYSLAKGQRLSGAFRILFDLFLGWISR